jgi:hypothetical protein
MLLAAQHTQFILFRSIECACWLLALIGIGERVLDTGRKSREINVIPSLQGINFTDHGGRVIAHYQFADNIYL